MAECLRSMSPADPSDEVGRFETADAAAVEAAVLRAREAFPAWRDLGLAGRIGVLERFRDLAAARKEELAQLIAREMGKAIWDARGEAALLAPKVDVTLKEGLRFAEPLDGGPGARATFHPRGVLAVLGPFNFPAHLPNGHIVPALALGNTVVFKPSELTPAVGAWMAALWSEAGLPEGVLGLVQGDAEVGQELSAHPQLDGILFTGSWNAGRSLRELTVDQPHKLLALEMGGKNAILVWNDADLDRAVAETALSMCATTGQRCSCASRVFVHRDVFDRFRDSLIEVLRGVRIGDPLDPDTFMGPLVSQRAFERTLRARARAADAGGRRLLGGTCERGAPWVGPGLVEFDGADQGHSYHRDEIFAPEAGLYPIGDLDHAIAVINDSDYGLVASVFSNDRPTYEHCIGRVQTGLLNWNKGTIGASGRLPFGGRGRSGNDRPAGIHATLYCSVPQSHLEFDAREAGPLDPSTLPPGMPAPGAAKRGGGER